MMKTKNIVKASLFTLILALLVTGTVTLAAVMKKDRMVAKTGATTWHFTGNSTAEILQADKWASGSSSDPNCESDPTAPLPCQYTVTDEDIADEDELMDYFAAKYPSNTATQVRNNADSQKPIE